MHTTTIVESHYIPARPEVVYRVLADYRVGHPAILPRPYFQDLRVVEGGYGHGTVIDVDMEVFGVKRSLRMEVTEPQPGYILAERDVDTGTETQFIFEPHEDGCMLTFHVKMNFSGGIGGYIEKLTTPPISRRIFRKELRIIADYVQRIPEPA